MRQSGNGVPLRTRPPVLQNRLAAAAQYIRKGSIAADIGTDHALLPVWLTMNGVCPMVYACDINKGPLERASGNIELFGQKERVAVRLGDGLEGLEGTGVTDIVIAGMGGELIYEIISKAPWVKNPQIRLILQPMTSASKLRRWLWENGFEISGERIAMDGNRLFVILCVLYKGGMTSHPRLWELVGDPALKKGDTLFGRLLKREITRQKKVYYGLIQSQNKSDTAYAKDILLLIDQLEDELKEWERWQR